MILYQTAVPDINDLGMNPNANNFHNYGDTHVLGAINDFDGPGLLYENLTEQPAPSLFGWEISNIPVKSGETKNLRGFGPVTHYIDPQNMTIVNMTVDGHMLHPGIVTRTIHEVNGQYVITTMGIENGAYPNFNDWFSDTLWGDEAARLRRETISEETNGQF